MNLEVSLKVRRARDSHDAISRILGLLETQVQTGGLYADYKTLTGNVEAKPLQDLLSDASRLAEEVREVFDTDFLDLGQWVEGGRLAALAGDPSFFSQGDTRSFLRRLLWRQKLGIGETKLPPDVFQNLEGISTVLGKHDLEASDYAELKRRSEHILETYYPQPYGTQGILRFELGETPMYPRGKPTIEAPTR